MGRRLKRPLTQREFRQCHGKIRWPSKTMAQAKARALFVRGAAYRCERCGHWHISARGGAWRTRSA